MDARSLITLLSFTAFIGIVLWAYSKHSRKGFDEAAQLPFADDDMQRRSVNDDKRITGAVMSTTATSTAGSSERSTAGQPTSDPESSEHHRV